MAEINDSGQTQNRTVPITIVLEEIHVGSANFGPMLALWGMNRRWLGLLPVGAFEEHAQKRCILGAKCSETGQLCGYVLFRHSRGWTHIVHLCVLESFRRHMVGARLLEELRNRSMHLGLTGIRLKCRRDFPASAFWERSGFVAGAETEGRGKSAAELTVWVKSHGLPDLFTRSMEETPGRVRAVIDANVFYQLVDEGGTDSDESKALREGWVEDVVELCFVDELFNDIDRAPFRQIRDRHRVQASTFRQLSYTPDSISGYVQILKEILAWMHPTAQQNSDMRHIAKAAGGGASHFITRDGELLQKSDEIEEFMNIRVMRPTSFLCQLDQLEREELYAPARLAGSGLMSNRMHASDIAALDDSLRAAGYGESRERFQARLRAAIAKSVTSKAADAILWRITDDPPVACYTSARTDKATLDLTFFRVAKIALAPTLARYVVQHVVNKASSQGYSVIRLTDPNAGIVVTDAMEDLHFRPGPAGLERFIVHGIIEHTEFGKCMGQLGI